MSTDDLRHRRTARLDLTAVGVDDTDELWALNRDPRVWTHFPSGVHTRREQTAEHVEHFVAAWAREGLGYWTVRSPEGTFLGLAGCMELRGGWNVYYRITPEAQGHGYAVEVLREAIGAAHDLRPDRPVVASLLEHNAASKAVAERLGLRLVFRGPATGADTADAVRLLYADRDLDPDTVARLLPPGRP